VPERIAAAFLDRLPATMRMRLGAHGSVRRRVMAGMGWSLFGAVTARATLMIASILAGRILGVTGFGGLGIIQSTVDLVAIAGGLGLAVSGTRFIAAARATPERVGQLISHIVRITLISALVASLLFLLCSSWIADTVLGAPQLAPELRAAAPLLFFAIVVANQIGCLGGLEAFNIIAKASVMRGVAGAILMLTGLHFGSVAGALLGLAAADALTAALQWIYLRQEAGRRAIALSSSLPADARRELRRFSVPALLSSVATLPAMWLARVLLVNGPDGLAQVGLFTAAQKWSTLILFVPTAMSSIVLPVMSDLYATGDASGFRRVYRFNLMISLAAVGVPALTLVLFGRFLMQMFGADYTSASSVLRILALACIPMVMNSVLGQITVSTGRIWTRLVIDVALSVTLVATAIVAVPALHATGLAIAHLAAFTVSVVLLFLAVRTAAAPERSGDAAAS
jgi:O-antigen/teichoic acid export membrane protein